MAEISLKSLVAADSRLSVTTYLSVWEKSTDIATNTSKMGYSYHIDFTGSLGFRGTTRTQAGVAYFSANGKQIASKTIALESGWGANSGTKYSGSGEFTVEHDSDGSKSIGFNIQIADGTDPRGANYYYQSGNNAGSLVLTKINRIAKIDSFNVGNNIGEAFNVKYTTYVSGYTYKLRISLPNVTALQTTDYNSSGASVSLTSQAINTLISKIKQGDTSVKLGAVIETYSGSTKLGESAEIVKTLNLAAQPTITNIDYKRTNDDGSPNDEGSFISVSFDYSFDYLNTNNSGTVSIEYRKKTAEVYTKAISKNVTSNGTLSVVFPASGENTYVIQLTAKDKFNTLIQKRNVSGVETTWDLRLHTKDGTDGFSLGSSAEYRNCFNIPPGWEFTVDGVPINRYAKNDVAQIGDGTSSSRFIFHAIISDQSRSVLFTVPLPKGWGDLTPSIQSLKLNISYRDGVYILGNGQGYKSGGYDLAERQSENAEIISASSDAQMLTVKVSTSGTFSGQDNSIVTVEVADLKILFE